MLTPELKVTYMGVQELSGALWDQRATDARCRNTSEQTS
jgi:hypothetical protein